MIELRPAEQAKAARMCASCPKMCRSACPTLAVTGNERHQPWGHARQIVDAMDGRSGVADAAVVDGVYACATCSTCTPPCHVDGVETPDLVWAARAAVHAAGATPARGVEAVEQARAGRVPSGVPARDGTQAWTDPAAVLDALRELATPGANVLFLPGCGALGRRPQATLAAGRALRALGVAFDVTARHRCCGMPALTFGDEAATIDMLTALRDVVTHHGATTVSVQSPSCAWMLGVRAERLDVAITDVVVEPLAATLARGLGARGATSSAPTTQLRVAYHDPCYLARHQRCRDEPRAALQATGHEITELHRRGDTTRCSGQGGGLPLTHPDIAAGYLRLLSAEISTTQAAEVITGCATCAAALDGAGLRALELAEAVAAALDDAGMPAP